MTTSIIIPNLDSELVGRTLSALIRQGAPGPEVEVLVVGRDSPGLVPRGGAVRFLDTGAPVVPAVARNLGAAAARGQRLLFTDADCRPAPGWIERLNQALAVAPVVGGAVTFPKRGSRWALADNIASFHELLPDRPAEDDTRGPLGSLNLGITRTAWERVGPFDPELATSEDLDWVLRARAAGLATAFLPVALVEHAAVRQSRAAVRAHAAWYGRHFHRFRRRHPGVFDRGWTWRDRQRFAATALAKAVLAPLFILPRHPCLAGCWRAAPGLVAFKRAWYRAVLESWEEGA